MDTSIHAHFRVLVDPRVDRTRQHKLVGILVIALSAVICGAEHFTEMEAFGKAKEAWFRRFLELPNGIPSHDTFRRVLSLLDPAQFQACFLNWVRDVAQLKLGEVIAIDGKRLNGSLDGWLGKAAQIISVWATKQGVEFKTYATYQLPHARVVAIESEREFGLSVLQGLDAEMERRGHLFTAAGVKNIADYR